MRLLQPPLRHIPGQLPVIRDGSPIHRGRAGKDFLAHGGAERIPLDRPPGYAPDVNPAAGVGRQWKRVAPRHRRSHDLPELQGAFRRAAARPRHKRRVVKACIKHAVYPV